VDTFARARLEAEKNVDAGSGKRRSEALRCCYAEVISDADDLDPLFSASRNNRFVVLFLALNTVFIA
jgi:hypothetical protein